MHPQFLCPVSTKNTCLARRDRSSASPSKDHRDRYIPSPDHLESTQDADSKCSGSSMTRRTAQKPSPAEGGRQPPDRVTISIPSRGRIPMGRSICTALIRATRSIERGIESRSAARCILKISARKRHQNQSYHADTPISQRLPYMSLHTHRPLTICR